MSDNWLIIIAVASLPVMWAGLIAVPTDAFEAVILLIGGVCVGVISLGMVMWREWAKDNDQ